MEIRRLRSAHFQGFTLFELITTLSISAVVVTIGVPAFSQLLANTRITTTINELLTDIHFARSESINRGQRVAICPSADSSRCLGSRGWQRGWIVFVDENRDRIRNPSEMVLRTHPAIPSQIAIDSGRRARIIYQADGTLVGVLNGTYTLCDLHGSAASKAIIISRIGRPRVSTTRSDGTPLSCS